MRRNIEKLSGELTNLKNSQTKPEPELPRIKEPNQQFPAFSRSVSLKYEEGRGRFGVAARDVVLGELLCVERPALSFLHPEPGLACSHCFTASPAPLPSPFSANTVFCSRWAEQ